MTSTTDQQLAQLGLKILYSVFRPAADEAAEEFFGDPEAHEVAPTHMES